MLSRLNRSISVLLRQSLRDACPALVAAVAISTFVAVDAVGATQGVPASATTSESPLGPKITDAISRERLDPLLEAGHDALVVQTFRRHAGNVLPFIDGYLEEGLALIESDASSQPVVPPAAMALYARALRFAELADRAFGETIFVEYTAGFASWSPTERVRFREGQRQFRAGRKAIADDPAAALDLYRRSFLLAESVGDHWGMVMCFDGIADAAARVDRLEEAHEAAIKAVSLNGRLQLRESHVRSMLTAGRLQARMQLPGGGVQYLLHARQMLPTEASTELRKEILNALLPALEAAGRTGDVERIKKEEASRAELMGAN